MRSVPIAYYFMGLAFTIPLCDWFKMEARFICGWPRRLCRINSKLCLCCGDHPRKRNTRGLPILKSGWHRERNCKICIWMWKKNSKSYQDRHLSFFTPYNSPHKLKLCTFCAPIPLMLCYKRPVRAVLKIFSTACVKNNILYILQLVWLNYFT